MGDVTLKQKAYEVKIIRHYTKEGKIVVVGDDLTPENAMKRGMELIDDHKESEGTLIYHGEFDEFEIKKIGDHINEGTN